MITALLKKLSGNWYNEYIFFKYRVHKMSFWQRILARFLFMPMSSWRRINKSIRNRLEIPSVELSIITPCHPHCRDCVNLNHVHPQPVDLDRGRLTRDVDDFLSNVDRVHRFIIMGGETFLYRELHPLLSHLIKQDKIDLVHLYTNGSIIPQSHILQLLKHCKILVTVSSFPRKNRPTNPVSLSP